MIQNVLRAMGGIDAYGVISVCLFISIFAATLAWAFLLRRPFLQRMGSLPLEEQEPVDALQPSAPSAPSPSQERNS